jgi:signal transduction histidine kinase
MPSDQERRDPAILDRLPEAVVLLDADGRISHVNDRARVVLGLEASDVGKPLNDVLALTDDTGSWCQLPLDPPAVGDRLAERTLHRVEGDGARRPVAIAGRWSPEGWVLTARPAGRREALDRVHGDVVATVSHEIRSPLSSVKGFTRTLLARWDRFNDEQKRTMLETVDADADRVTRLLMDLLEVSRIDAGRVQLRRSSVDMAGLVDATVDKARHRDDGRDREMVVHLDDALPRISADADRVEQVLTNLVDNALRYAPEGRIDVTARVDGNGIRLTVADEGPGVDPELRRTIFRKFGRGRHDQRAGTGLGLYISRGLVTAHGGWITLDDSVTPGAPFNASFPIAS